MTLGSHSTTRATTPRTGRCRDLLGLALELRFERTVTAVRPAHDVAAINALDPAVACGDLRAPRVALDGRSHRLQEGLLEAGEMGTALRRGDDVDEESGLPSYPLDGDTRVF